MSVSEKLLAALDAVQLDGNLNSFKSDVGKVNRMATTGYKFAVWARELEENDKGNAALCFIREMEIAAQFVAVLIGFSLYKPAAASMRAIIETCLYFSYFRTHQTELSTLVRSKSYYVTRSDIFDYHLIHTPDFKSRQNAINLKNRLDECYSKLSAIVHGQLPGVWVKHQSIKDITFHNELCDLAIAEFDNCYEVVRRLFLCTVAQECWDGFSTSSKKLILKALSGEEKEALSLDAA